MSQTKAQLISDLVQSLNFSGTSAAPANGMYLSAANTIKLATNTTPRLTIDSSGNATFTGTVVANAFTGNASSATSATTTVNVNLTDESSDATCYPIFATADTGTLPPKTGTNLTFNSSTGALSATSFVGGLPITSGADNRVITASSASAIQGEANLTFDGNALTVGGELVINHDDWNTIRAVNTNANTYGAYLVLAKKSSSPADDDQVGVINFRGDNDAGEELTYVSIIGKSTDVTDGSEDGQLEFHTVINGTYAERLRIDSSGRIGIGTTAPESYYAKDLVLNCADDGGFTLIGGTGHENFIMFADGTSGNAAYRGYIGYNHNGDYLTLAAGGGAVGYLRIDINGQVGIATSPESWDSASWATLALGPNRGTISSYKASGYPSLWLTSNSHAEGNGWSNTWKQSIQSASSQYAPCRYYQYGGTHYFQNSASRNDDNDITWTEQLHIQADNNVNIKTGNLIIGTAGKGIDFSVNSSAGGMSSELLDGYEEGTWTPTYRGTTTAGSSTYSTQTGHYIRVGSHVTLWFYIGWTANSSSGGGGAIGGLPYTGKVGSYSAGAMFWNNYNIDANRPHIVLHQSGNSSMLYLYASGDNNGWDSVPLDDAANIIGSITYTI